MFNRLSVTCLVLLLLVSNFLYPAILLAVGERVIINEIAAYELAGSEWVEIYNTGSTSVDLSGWKFWEGNVNHGLTVTRGSFVLGVGEYAIIAQDGGVFVSSHEDVAVTVLDSSWGSLNESGEEIGLKDSVGSFIEQFTYIEAKDFSLQRIDPLENIYTSVNWDEHADSHTAGKANVVVEIPDDGGGEPPTDDEEPPVVVVPLFINEFVSDSNEGEREWIELYNGSDGGVDLTGWTLEDATGSVIASPTSTIASSDFFVVQLSSVRLNNGGDTIRLKNALAQVVDEIIYGTGQAPVPDKAQSVARVTDGSDTDAVSDFVLTTTVTPGQANVITSVIGTSLSPKIPPDPPPSGGSGGGGSVRMYAPHDVVINELVSDPGDGMDEFVELFNTTGGSISLDGWHLEDGSETETVLTGNIESKKFFLIERPKGSLNNAGDAVVLFDPSGKKIDSVTYGTWDDGNSSDNATAPGDPYSLARKMDGQDSDNEYYDFVLTTTITSGRANVISVPQQVTDGSVGVVITSGTIRINEIFPNPKGSDSNEEYIELKNIGKETVDLKDWKLSDSSTKRYTITQGRIAPGGFMVFKRTMTGIALNNTGGDDVKLYTSTGVLTDQSHYSGAAVEEQSYVRTQEGRWVWTTKRTPEQENVIEGAGLAPVIALDVETEVAVGEPVIFDASDSTSEQGTLVFAWEFGDGDTGQGSTITHAYLRQGKFTATVTASALSVTSTKKVVITVKDPLAFIGGPSGDASGILISEIFPNPAGSDDGEFIELFNPTEFPIDLSGMKLDDEDGGSKPYTIPDGIIIGAGEYLVFKREETKLALNNTTDAARLVSSEGDVILEVEFEAVKEGASYTRDGKMWAWSAEVTPGEINIIVGENKETKKLGNSKRVVKGVKVTLETTLDKIREQDVGDRVKVTGVVSVLPNVFGTQYFYIASEQAPVGVQVYMYKKEFPTLAVGDRIEVTGEIAESSGETRIKVAAKSDIQKIGTGGLAKLAMISSEDVGETYEGSLISIAGEVTEVKKTYLYLDDGLGEVKVYFKKGAGVDSKNVRPGDLVTVTGVVNQTKAGYQLLPRAGTDIAKTGVSPDVVSEIKTEENQTAAVAETYLSTTAGGLTAIFLGLVAKTRGALAVAFGKKTATVALGVWQKLRG